MSKILDNIHIWVFLVNIESGLLLALVKYMLCSHLTQNCILLYFLEAKNPYFGTKNCWKFSYIYVFILSQKRRNWFHKNLHNSEMFGCRKLPDPALNRIFNALPLGVQCTLSFQWANFGVECLLLVLTKPSFWQGGWAQGYHSMELRQFPHISKFPKILSLNSFSNWWGNSYILSL